MPALLELSDIARCFPGVTALDGVTFDLAAGEVHALVGENGAGKSTLINIVSGVLMPDTGTVRLEGRPVHFTSPVAARMHGVVTVHQEADLFETLSVAENMALSHGLRCNAFGHVAWRAIHAEAEAAVRLVGEQLDVRQPASRLSVAHRHMIQVAAAVTRRAKIVILDEPTSALTVKESEWLFEQVARLKAAGVGVVYISHRQEEIFQLADRITVLRDGRRVWTRARGETDRAEVIEAMVGRRQTTASRRKRIPHAGDQPAPIRFASRGVCDQQGKVLNVNLHVRAGEIVGVYGLVGAGRSEWAQTVFGLRKQSGGEIAVDGQLVQIESPIDAVRAGFAYLPEDRLRQGVCRGLSVRANTVLSSLCRWSRRFLIDARAERRVTHEQSTQLSVRMRHDRQPVGQLSGGNQQKVVFARWLLTEPRVLILDEPTRGVDVGAKAEIHRLIRDLADNDCAVVMISSELPEIMEHSDRIVVFRNGEVVGDFDRHTTTPVMVAQQALPTDALDADELAARRGKTLRSARLPRNELGLLIAVVCISVVMALTTDRFLTRDNLLGILTGASIWTILALGSAAVILSGGIDISIGSLVALSAASAGLVLQIDAPTAFTVPMGVLTGLGVGLLGGWLNAGVSLAGRIHPIVVTLGTMTVFRGFMAALTGGASITRLPDSFRALVIGKVCGVSGSIIAMILVLALAYYFLGWTRLGRHLFAFGSSRSAARQVGISPRTTWLTSFGLGGLCAGCAGLVELGISGTMQPVLGTGYELQSITAAVIGGTAITGGKGSVAGVFLGVLLLRLAHNGLVLRGISGFQYDLVVGGLLLTAVLIDVVTRRVHG